MWDKFFLLLYSTKITDKVFDFEWKNNFNLKQCVYFKIELNLKNYNIVILKKKISEGKKQVILSYLNKKEEPPLRCREMLPSWVPAMGRLTSRQIPGLGRRMWTGVRASEHLLLNLVSKEVPHKAFKVPAERNEYLLWEI